MTISNTDLSEVTVWAWNGNLPKVIYTPADHSSVQLPTTGQLSPGADFNEGTIRDGSIRLAEHVTAPTKDAPVIPHDAGIGFAP